MKKLLTALLIVAATGASAGSDWDFIAKDNADDPKCYAWNDATGEYQRVSCGPSPTEEFFDDLGDDIKDAFDW